MAWRRSSGKGLAAVMVRAGDRQPDRAGVLTPATAMGATLAERLT